MGRNYHPFAIGIAEESVIGILNTLGTIGDLSNSTFYYLMYSEIRECFSKRV